MKKIIIAFVILVAIGSLSYILYLHSDFYKNKLAVKAMNQRIEELNKMQKLYIYEGVYSFNNDVYESNNYTNEFGERIVKHTKIRTDRVRISFKSEKIVIICNGIREEINLGRCKVLSYSLEDKISCTYEFSVEDWKVYEIKNNNCIYNLKKVRNENGEPKFVTLTLKKNEIPILVSGQIFISLSGNKYDFQHLRDKIEYDFQHFDDKTNQTFLYLENLEEKYNSIYLPTYVNNSRYEDKIYELNNYK